MHIKMTTKDTYQLTHPELMSEKELCEILRNSCIEIHNFEELSKSKLLEIYNRVALPLPQRGSEEENYLESKVDSPAKSSDSWGEESSSETSEQTVLNENGKRSCDSMQEERLKPPIQDCNSLSKKIRLSNSSRPETEPNNISKRTVDLKSEDINIASVMKRQKITWP